MAIEETVAARSLSLKRVAKRLYDVKEAATYLGRTEDATRELQWAGKLPCVRLDRRVFFDVFDLDRIIEEHKITDEF